MPHVSVALAFSCWECNCNINVKLCCNGPGIRQGPPAAAVLVACPDCEAVQQVIFELDGRLLDVLPYRKQVLEPSLN